MKWESDERPERCHPETDEIVGVKKEVPAVAFSRFYKLSHVLHTCIFFAFLDNPKPLKDRKCSTL